MSKKPSALSDQLRLAIEQSEHSRYAIHKATGIDQAVLSKFVHGERGVSLDTVDILGEYLGLEITLRNKTKGGRR
jgi:plasmid maintenance system antidote protein VapI